MSWNILQADALLEADETAARMLCANGYRWVVEHHVASLLYSVEHGLEHNSPKHPSRKEEYEYLSAILKESQEDGNKLMQVALQWSHEHTYPELNSYLRRASIQPLVQLVSNQARQDKRKKRSAQENNIEDRNKPQSLSFKKQIFVVTCGVTLAALYHWSTHA
jgi:hypothetical protein